MHGPETGRARAGRSGELSRILHAAVRTSFNRDRARSATPSRALESRT
ncbi:Hypothetical protein I596_3503 [Dokdonella koreensis DS-123]|uniref:Uncharacterized protein n=1 Tax=Dokdonella koreensis DS-123 TaxID=1300342 RepID=A0A160DYK7_9GAMM|nr:Hypothetical protein I596_3503 [Dokdonella koreensis DS-123]